MSLPHASDKFHFVINSIKSPNSSLGNLGLFGIELLISLISLISRDSMIDVGSTSINTYNFLLYYVKSMIPLIIKINSLYNIVYLIRNLLYHRQSTLLLQCL